MSEDFDPPIKGIVTATGVAVAQSQLADNPALAHAILAAMTKAVEDANADGVNDPDVIRERILKARDTAWMACLFTDEVHRQIEAAKERGETP